MIPPPRPSNTLGPGNVLPGGTWTPMAIPFAGGVSFPGLGGGGMTTEDDGNALGGAAGGGGIVGPSEGLIDAAGGQGSCC